MRVGAVVLVMLLGSADASAQVDAGTDESAKEQAPQDAQVRNKTTATRISSPNPTTQGVPWSFPLFWDQLLSVRTLSAGSELSYSFNYT